MPFANPTRVAAQIYTLLGRPSQTRLPYRDVHAARIESGMEILRAISKNPQSGYYGSLQTLVDVEHNAFLPAHEGDIGIPLIEAFAGAPLREGYPADPDEIDSYRLDVAGLNFYSGALDGLLTPHDQPDANGYASPVAGRYSVVNGRFKFTGFSAQAPIIELTRAMADTLVPENLEPTLVKLSIPRLARPDDAIYALVGQYIALAEQDLAMLQAAAVSVPSLPQITTAQKQVI